MATPKKYNAVCLVGDRPITVGTLYEFQKGKFGMRLDVVPACHKWDGLIFFEGLRASDTAPPKHDAHDKDRAINPVVPDGEPF